MTDYYKRVEIRDTGLVLASVFRADGTRCGLNWWAGPWPWSVKKCAEQAHTWADEHIETCRRHECGVGGRA